MRSFIFPPRGGTSPKRGATNTRRYCRRTGVGAGDSFLLFCLAPHGVCPASSLTVGAVSSYLAFSPLLRPKTGRFVFCDTFRRHGLSSMAPMLSHGVLPCGVRTFLSRKPGFRQRSLRPHPRRTVPCGRILAIAVMANAQRCGPRRVPGWRTSPCALPSVALPCRFVRTRRHPSAPG